MSDAIFEITDGTTTISLINKSSGFHMIRWTPGITDYKGGGVFTNPPLADWRQLRVGKWDTVQEQFGVTINGQNPNGVAYMLQELRRMLEKANAYWTTDWQNDPVYLAAKANCETETRYCLIVKGRLANDQNYYQQPFTGKRSTMQDLPLIIERRAWLEIAPGTRTAVPISNEVEYDGRTLGRAATTADEVFHANKRTVANITNVHIGTAGANLMNASPPFTILNVSGTNSTYFGIDTSLTDSGPFDSLIFDIGTAQVGATVVWEYWNGSAWTSLNSWGLRDDTTQFTNTGVNSVVWVQPDDWVAASPGGALPVGYYVRARVTATGSTNATQQNRIIYSQTVPYVEIAAGQVPGDIPALMQLTVNNLLYRAGSSAVNLSKIIFCLRSTSRGISAFTPYINISDDQNPAGVTISAGNGTFTTNSQYPTGRVSVVTIGGAGSSTPNLGIIDIDASVVTEFYGRYRVYARFGTTSGFSLLETKLRVFDASGTGLLYDTGYYDIPLSIANVSVDLGTVPILPDVTRVNPGDIRLTLSVNYTATTSTNITAVDLILMPIDEWSAEFIVPEDLFENYIDASSLRQKIMIEALTRNSSDERQGVVRSVNNGPCILQANATQRLYSFAQEEIGSGNTGEFGARTGLVKQGQLWRNGRYLSLRGER